MGIRFISSAVIAAAWLVSGIVTGPVAAQERKQRGQLITEGVPDTPPDVEQRLAQYMTVRSAVFEGFLPNGGILIRTKFGETEQLHEVASPLGMRRQITFFDEPISGGGTGVRPGATDAVYFLKDEGGDERYQGFLLDRASGRTKPFTEPSTRTEELVFEKSGQRAAWAVVRSNSSDRQIVVGDPSNSKDRRVVFTGTGGGQFLPRAFSLDGKHLLLAQYISASDSRRLIVDLGTGRATQVNPTANPVAYGYAAGDAFSADGRSIYVVSDEGSEFQRLVKIDLATNRQSVVTPGIEWDVEYFSFTNDATVLAYVVNEQGSSRLRLRDMKTGRELTAPPLPPGAISQIKFDETGRRLGISLTSATVPGDVWVWDMRDSKLTRWTNSETGGLPETAFVTPKLVQIPSFDGLNVPAFLYTPRTPGPYPVVIQIHGGPEAQSRNEFLDPRLQYWVNELGIAVLMPNIRGSVGYGKTYESLDDGFKRQDAIKDVGAVIDWVGKQPDLKKDNVAVHGGSWGGYAVLASLATYPDKLAGGIDIVGSSNLVTFLERTETYRRDLRRVEYGDERDPAMREYLNKIAPLTNARNIKGPLFVVHGANDPRVKQAEAEQIIAAVRENGREAWYMLALDEGHGYAKKGNIRAWIGAETMFLRKIFGVK